MGNQKLCPDKNKVKYLLNINIHLGCLYRRNNKYIFLLLCHPRLRRRHSLCEMNSSYRKQNRVKIERACFHNKDTFLLFFMFSIQKLSSFLPIS